MTEQGTWSWLRPTTAVLLILTGLARVVGAATLLIRGADVSAEVVAPDTVVRVLGAVMLLVALLLIGGLLAVGRPAEGS